MQIHPAVTGVQTGQAQSAYNSANTQAAEAAGAEQTEKTAPTQQPDRFVRSNQARPDIERLNELRQEHARNVAAFRAMVQQLLGQQANPDGSFSLVLNIDEATQLQAKEAISENGDWGVEAVATRILDFAKAISGGDPSFINMLRHSFEAGFAAAERVWGGALPEISQQTRDRVLEGFRQWEEGAAAPATSA